MNKELYQEAESFIRQYYKENELPDVEERLSDVKKQIEDTGTYQHTYHELVYGAKVAWRNSNRCIGRLFWENLNVFDHREVDDEEAIYHALLEHIDFATNKGRIRSTISIFRPKVEEKEIRIWNHQLVRYAGYEEDGVVTGDPASVEFTRMCQKLGWEGEGGSFDVLPLVIQIDHHEPKWFNIPSEKVMEVPLRHPEYDWFDDLEFKWYAVPFISDMQLEIGGVEYTAAPFNGWYMGTEIGARNLADEFRYNLLPTIAEGMGLDTKRNSSLWKDRALIELNQAVLHSYREAKVSIVDHHTAAQQFQLFEKKENKADRQATGDWTWLIPPVSPAATNIFHSSYEDRMDSPNYFYQKEAYKKCPFHSS
nr:nitric oxide synthase oxygenase [Halobacillus litoralis]